MVVVVIGGKVQCNSVVRRSAALCAWQMRLVCLAHSVDLVHCMQNAHCGSCVCVCYGCVFGVQPPATPYRCCMWCGSSVLSELGKSRSLSGRQCLLVCRHLPSWIVVHTSILDCVCAVLVPPTYAQLGRCADSGLQAEVLCRDSMQLLKSQLALYWVQGFAHLV